MSGLFKKGMSGNPNGRPAGFAEFTQLCREKAPAALNRIERLAQHKDPTIRFGANKFLIERAWGRPVTPVIDASGLAADSFVIRAPSTIPSAEGWERTIELGRGGCAKRTSGPRRPNAGLLRRRLRPRGGRAAPARSRARAG